MVTLTGSRMCLCGLFFFLSVSLQEELRLLLSTVIFARDNVLTLRKKDERPPVLVKVSPDLSSDDITDIAEVGNYPVPISFPFFFGNSISDRC